jgi:hypothetical protein
MRPSTPSIVSLDPSFCLCTTEGRVSCKTMTRGTCAPRMSWVYVAFSKTSPPSSPCPHQHNPLRLGFTQEARAYWHCQCIRAGTQCACMILRHKQEHASAVLKKPAPSFWAMPHICLLACPDLCCIHALSLPAAAEPFYHDILTI